MHKITIIIGSLRKESFNRKLALGLADLGKEIFNFEFAEIGQLPLFSEDLEPSFPLSAQALKDSISRADGVLIVAPEYNRSIPGPLKNALDWASRPGGANAWGGKCVATAGMSPGATGTSAGQAHLRSVLSFLGALQMVHPEVYLQYSPDLFDANNRIIEERCKSHLLRFLNSFAAWIDKYK